MKIESALTHERVRHDQNNEVNLVLTLTAPKKEISVSRPPICTILVADVSGSMKGDKLDKVKKSMMKLVDHLMPGDYCGLAAFSSEVYPIAPPREMSQAQKEELKTKIGALRDIQSTNLSGGLLQGLEWGRGSDLPEKVLVRVILFTDGQANCGVAKDTAGLVGLLKSRGRVTVSAFGYGHDADQDMLASIAKEGCGNYAFIENPDDAMSAFGKELGGLLSTYAVGVEIVLDPQNGHQVVEVVSDVDVSEREGKVVVKLPDVLSEESRQIVARLNLVQQPQALPREMTVVNVSVSYDLVSDTGEKERKTESVKARVRFVKPGDEQKDPTKEVDEAVVRAILVKSQIEAEAQANVGNFAEAQLIMRSTSARARRGGHAKLDAFACKLESKMSSRAQYAASTGYRKSALVGTSRGMGISSMDAEARADVADMGYVVSNSVQDAMVSSFDSEGTPMVSPGHPVPGPVVIAPAVSLDAVLAPAPAPVSKPQTGKKGVAKSRSDRW